MKCLPPASNCGTLMSFSTSFWSVEGVERHRLDSRYKVEERVELAGSVTMSG